MLVEQDSSRSCHRRQLTVNQIYRGDISRCKFGRVRSRVGGVQQLDGNGQRVTVGIETVSREFEVDRYAWILGIARTTPVLSGACHQLVGTGQVFEPTRNTTVMGNSLFETTDQCYSPPGRVAHFAIRGTHLTRRSKLKDGSCKIGVG